jgi:cytochrome b561/polyisoprenoid-binding protein YceI
MSAMAHDPDPVQARRYSTGAVVLHWLTVAAIVFQLALAWRMNGPRSPETFAAFQLHKSVGITILALSLARLGWRLANPPPPMSPTLAAWERRLAHVTHIGFYVILIGMPLTGWLAVSTSRLRLPTLLYGTIPWPDLPGLAGLSAEARKMWRKLGENGHEVLAYLLLALLVLHVAGALKHQLFDRHEPVLGRMLPGAKPGRWFDPRLIAVVVVLCAVAAFGLLAKPPLPHGVGSAASAAAPPAAPAEPAPTAAPVAAPAAAPTTPATAAAPSTPAAAPAAPVRWVVAPGSTLSFDTSWSGDAIHGRFDKWKADILFGPGSLDRSKVKVDVDVASIKTGDDQRDGSLPGEDWFDAAAHPTATFTADRFEKIGPDRYRARGKLSIRGVSQPISLPFRLKIDGDTARASGVTTIDRTAFGVGQGEWKSTDQIPAKVTVAIDLKARRG